MLFAKRAEAMALFLFIVKLLALLLTALSGAIIAIWLFGASTVEVESIEFKVALVPGRNGITELHFPPFGVVEATTHQGPVKLLISLQQIKSESFKAHIENPPDHQEIVEQIQNAAKEKITAFVVRQVSAAFLGALILVFLIWRPGLLRSLVYAIISTLILCLLLTWAFHSYDTETFHEPEYKGVLSMAPTAVKFVTDSLTDLEQIRENTRQIVSNLGLLFSSADSLMAMADPEEQGDVVKVLLVSDLHSNPVGIELTTSLAKRFGVDFLINAGDLTDMGLQLETGFTQELAAIGVPQLFVSGNHDSPETMEFVKSLPDSYVLNGQMLTIKGVTVMGFADPLSAVSAVQYENNEEEQEAFKLQLAGIREAVNNQGKPDILVVHDTKLGKRLLPLAHLTVAGHDHRMQIMQKAGSVFINPGTTGAAGLRGFYSENGVSYSAAIIYIVPGSGLVAVDMVKYNPVSQQFSLERKLLNGFAEGKPGQELTNAVAGQS